MNSKRPMGFKPVLGNSQASLDKGRMTGLEAAEIGRGRARQGSSSVGTQSCTVQGSAAPLCALVLALAGAASGCVLSEMHPGDSCARCHEEKSAARFGAAGTVYRRTAASEDAGISDISVDVTDTSGRSVSLASNSVGNFYTDRVLTPPLQVTLSRAGAVSVSSTAPSGDCNSCHTDGSSLGRIYIP
jgi:hypothetical protein